MNEISRKPSVSEGLAGGKTLVHELVDLSAIVAAPADDQIGMLLT
jgi:hypothetical protein